MQLLSDNWDTPKYEVYVWGILLHACGLENFQDYNSFMLIFFSKVTYH